jgi:hypothetical protein
VVAVIDDAIEVPREATEGTEGAQPITVSSRFWRLRQNLQDRDILCHLHHYPRLEVSATDDAAEPHIDHAVSVATAANVIVLDWHLGMTSGSEHSEAIIEQMAAAGGLRFVIINSNDPAEGIRDRLLQKNFGGMQFTVDAGPATPGAPIRAKVGDRIFILIRKKGPDNDEVEDATSLLDEVFKWLEGVFPDHLHWAGLELSSRIAEVLPLVLGTLPKSTDLPLFHQWIFNEDGETNSQVVSLLLDEIGLLLDLNPLSPLDDELIKGRITDPMRVLAAKSFFDQPGAKEALGNGLAEVKKNYDAVVNPKAGQQKKDPTPVTAAIMGFKKTWDEICVRKERAQPTSDLMAHFPGGKDKKKHTRAAAHMKDAFQVEAPPFEALAAWYESICSDLGTPKHFFPGAVFKKNAENLAADDPEWLLCVTPGCDCRWDKNPAYAFLPGRKIKPQDSQNEPMATCVSAGTDGAVTIGWKHKNVLLRPRGTQPALLDGYKLVGAIRPMHAARICQRTWSHQARIAVDVPEYTRASRGEAEEQ